jgi:hypothetical protein
MSESLDEGVKALLRERIEAFEHLEVLRKLHRQPEERWAPQTVADQLRISYAIAEAALEYLARHQLLATSSGEDGPRFAYSPKDPAVAANVDKLVRAYDDSIVEIMKLMSANAIERARTKALHFFADAFILGKKRDG